MLIYDSDNLDTLASQTTANQGYLPLTFLAFLYILVRYPAFVSFVYERQPEIDNQVSTVLPTFFLWNDSFALFKCLWTTCSFVCRAAASPTPFVTVGVDKVDLTLVVTGQIADVLSFSDLAALALNRGCMSVIAPARHTDDAYNIDHG